MLFDGADAAEQVVDFLANPAKLLDAFSRLSSLLRIDRTSSRRDGDATPFSKRLAKSVYAARLPRGNRRDVEQSLRPDVSVKPEMFFDVADALQEVIDLLGKAGDVSDSVVKSRKAAPYFCKLFGEVSILVLQIIEAIADHVEPVMHTLEFIED